MNRNHWDAAVERLRASLRGERQFFPVDPARRSVSMRPKGPEEVQILAHAIDVLIDVLRVVELEIDGYRRPYLALRCERMEQLGLASSQDLLSLWKWRSTLASAQKNGQSWEKIDAEILPAQAPVILVQVLEKLESKGLELFGNQG